MRLHHAPALATALLLAGCGGGGSGDPYDPGTNPTCVPTATRVCMTASAFDPVTLTVGEGTEVTWSNGTTIAHTVTSDPGSAVTYDQDVGGGGSFSFTFSTAGTYEYHCEIHGAPGTDMHGTIVVQ